jgi:muramoyltetrapeptide carboxypeptidase
MQRAKALQPGDTVGIAAPAGCVQRPDLLSGVSEIRRLGYRVHYNDSLFSRHQYFAGSHRQRAESLMNLFTDPGVKAIFCARGGYGCQHLLDLLDPKTLQAHPKIFLGYSDVTVLLQFLENQCGLVCFHGPMVAKEFAQGEPYYVRKNLLHCLTETRPGRRLHSPGSLTLQSGTARGRLTGGCLSLLVASLGTPYELQSQDRILFLEDINAKPYQVDRMLMQLKLAGKLQGVRAFIFGEMLDCSQAGQAPAIPEIALSLLKEFQVPIWYGLPSGHTSTGNLTLPFGVEVRLDAGQRWLQFEEAAVVAG